MKQEWIEIRLCTPADFLLGIRCATKGLVTEVAIGLLFFSIVITLKDKAMCSCKNIEVGYHNSLLSNEPKPLKSGAVFLDLAAVVYEFNEVIKPTHNGLPLYSVQMESFEVQDTDDYHYSKQILIAIYAGDKSKRSEADSPSEA